VKISKKPQDVFKLIYGHAGGFFGLHLEADEKTDTQQQDVVAAEASDVVDGHDKSDQNEMEQGHSDAQLRSMIHRMLSSYTLDELVWACCSSYSYARKTFSDVECLLLTCIVATAIVIIIDSNHFQGLGPNFHNR